MTVVLDGAHNENSLERLFAELQRRFRAGGTNEAARRVVCIFGANRNKSLVAMVRIVCRHCVPHSVDGAMGSLPALLLVKSDHPSAAPAEDLEALAYDDLGGMEQMSTESSASIIRATKGPRSVEEALRGAIALAADVGRRNEHGGEPIVVVCGSLYVVSTARALLVRNNPSCFPLNDPAKVAFELRN